MKTANLGLSLALSERYFPIHDLTYGEAGNCELKLDLYKPSIYGSEQRPTLLYFHGGGWLREFTKEQSVLQLLPFLQLGWVVVNADYRSSSVSLAPAAVEDCIAALRWVGRNAKEHGIDLRQLVLMGHSAGGHLALTTGMIPLSRSGLGAPSQFLDMYDPLTKQDAEQVPFKPAAIINWHGITDVVDLLEGPKQQPYAVKWIGNQPDRLALAQSVSPLSYVRAGLPPIVTVHGTKDRCVPYEHALRLHEALAAVRVPNKLISITDGEHGQFGVAALQATYAELFDFLSSVGLEIQSEG